MEFRVLGPLEIQDGAEKLVIGTPLTRTLLALLLITPGQVVGMDRLIDELWPEQPPSDARVLVHSYVSRLRRGLRSGPTGEAAANRLVTRKPGYLLQVGEQELDLHRYQRLVADARTARRAGSPQGCLALLRQADELWHGPPFADVPPTPAITVVAGSLAELRLTTLEEQFDVALDTDHDETLIARMTELAAQHPLRERLVSQMIVALHRTGRTADALATYQQTRHRLAEELGVDPGPELRQAHETVLAGRPPRVPGPAPSQLPADLPLLVGRDDLLADGRGVLASSSPLVAVTGPGGVGKSAFALCLADRARDLFPDGVLVSAPGSEPLDESMLTRFLSAFGIPADGRLPTDPRHRAAMFWDLLDGRRVLIVLDDVPDETYVRPLLPMNPGCGLLVTSRRRLTGLDAVHSLPLDVLSVEAGVRLLMTTAGTGRVAPDATAASQVVELCGGLPLAIKVTAARLTARPNWTIDDLAARLADTRSRLDWLDAGDLGVRTSLMESVFGLAESGQQLLRRLGSLDAGEFTGWVSAALLGLPAGPAERILDDLVEAHLVEPAGHGLTGPRYRMHDLVRLVARELADDTDVAATIQVRHGWLALAAAADDQLAHWFGVDSEPTPVWRPPAETVSAVAANPMQWFDEEHDALVSVVRQTQDAVTWALAQRMSTYLELRGRYDDWLAMLRAGLAAADALRDRQGQATMLGLLTHAESTRDEHLVGVRYGALTVAAYQALETPAPDFERARSVSTPVLEDARRRGDALAVGFEACRIALTQRLAGAQIDYLALFEEARDAFRIGGVPLLELWTAKNTGLVYLRQRRFAEAADCLRRAQAILQDGKGLVAAGGDLAGAAAAHGRTDLAEQLAIASIADAHESGDRWTAGRALQTLADVRARRGDPAAVATYQQALAVWTDLRMARRVAQVKEALAQLA